MISVALCSSSAAILARTSSGDPVRSAGSLLGGLYHFPVDGAFLDKVSFMNCEMSLLKGHASDRLQLGPPIRHAVEGLWAGRLEDVVTDRESGRGGLRGPVRLWRLSRLADGCPTGEWCTSRIRDLSDRLP